MFTVKKLEKTGESMLVYQCTWLVEETMRFQELTLCENAVLIAPPGKYVTLCVNGVNVPMEMGTYRGDVVLTVADAFTMPAGGLMMVNQITRDLEAGIIIEDGKYQANKGVGAALQGGTVTDTETDGLYLASSADSFNGIVVKDSEYTIRNSRFDFEGFSCDDFLGVGTGVSAVGNSKVLIEDCEFNFSGVTRCTVHAGGNSEVTVRNSRILNLSPKSDWLGSFSWQVGFAGTNRLTQLCDNATVTYDHCDLLTNGWGICSIDGSDEGVRMYIKNSRLELTGPRSHGYGTFCIGDNEIIWENSTVDVNGYPMLVMGMMGKGHAAILDSKVRGRRFGAMVVSDDNSVFDIKGSDFKTGKSSIVVKGSASTINIENSTFEAGNGVLLQLMDSDEGGMDMAEFIVPVGEEDVYTEGRDLTAVTEEDVIVNITGCELKGDLFNSTTNIRPTDRCPHGGMGKFHDTVIGHLSFPAPEPGAELPPPRHGGDDLKGAKNLGLTLVNTKIEGRISAARQAYREGLTVIREDNRLELTNITQWAAPTVNNGIVLSLDKDSVWTVTGDCYLTELKLEEGAVIKAAEGKNLTVTLDGAPVELSAGDYKGKLALLIG